MPTLISPGTSITVTDDTIGGSGRQGTTPLIFITTEENKYDQSGTIIAEGTKKSNAGKLYTVTSQRELIQLFGEPKFHEIGGTQLHGFELNEYGLLSAYSFLGASSTAYVVRADIDLAQLQSRVDEPTSKPTHGTYWMNLTNSKCGLFICTQVSPKVIWTAVEATYVYKVEDMLGGAPKASVPGNYAFIGGKVISGNTYENRVFKRVGSGWAALGTDSLALGNDYDVQFKPHYQVPATRSNATPLQINKDFWIKTTTPNSGMLYDFYWYNGDSDQWVKSDEVKHFYNKDAAIDAGYGIGGKLIAVDDVSNVNVYRHNGKSTTSVQSITVPAAGLGSGAAGILTINGIPLGADSGGPTPTPVPFTLTSTAYDMAGYINLNYPPIPDIQASVVNNKLVITNLAGKDIVLGNVSGAGAAVNVTLFGEQTTYSNWDSLTYEATFDAPVQGPVDGQLWYSDEYKVDILVNNSSGNAWINYPYDVYLQSAKPTSPVLNELWIDTDQVKDYPVIYKYDGSEWLQVDTTDQTTPDGIIFADVRASNTGSFDADAPNALAYPAGMLLWNTRYGTMNVKKFVKNHTSEGVLIGDRWVTESGNKPDGSPYMGSHAVRKVISNAIGAQAISNEQIRAEHLFYNLIAAPGFIECADEMITLNSDKKEIAFVIGDAPFGLKPSGTDIVAWAQNQNGAASNGADGLVSASPYFGVYYPSGLSTNTDGSEVVVPASHMILRTMAYNDNVAYPWFAPAGYARGLVQNASTAGYVSHEGEYVAIELSEGLRDVLYSNNINPINYETGRGLVVFGQKTRSPVASALDRVNVARLVNSVRWNADLIAKPFLFEPNDKQTRDAIKAAFDKYLSELVTLRGLSDFLSICDTSNNTPARIDRNELWVDLLIAPTRSAEFIYVPIRLKNTGEI